MAWQIPYEWQIGWRYTRAGRGARRNGFISFISAVSMVGIALGVAALIIVLSVMNGFQKEVRDRMLGVIPHLEVVPAEGGALADWRAVATAAQTQREVVGAAPFIAAQALLGRGEMLRGAVVRGIVPAEEATVTALGARLRDTSYATLQPGAWHIVLGAELARGLGVRVGDTVTMVTPGGQVTPVGVAPRLRTFTVSGTFDAGHFEYDSSLALVHLDDAARLFRLEGAAGVQLRVADPARAREVAGRLVDRLPPGLAISDWTRTNRHWYDAVQI